MQCSLNITAEWEPLNEGPPEERACFASVIIRCNNQILTEGQDDFVKRVRSGPLVSAYHLAEWFAWNWWRLRWEPRTEVRDWPFAHNLTTIGAGYVWPDIRIFSDGERTALVTRATTARAATAFRYINNYASVVSSVTFEEAIDGFIAQVLGQLQAENIKGTNLNQIWSDLTCERQDPEQFRRRKLEAMLGEDPDMGDPAIIERLVRDAAELGERAVEELAAESGRGGELLTAADLHDLAQGASFPVNSQDGVRLPTGTIQQIQNDPAWLLGAKVARIIREQERLENKPISNSTLAQMVGVNACALEGGSPGQKLSFALENSKKSDGRVVLRSPWQQSRRFELARLLADRLIAAPNETLHAATKAETYRQKMQRSFAAELLSPFDAIDAMLEGDYSLEAQTDAAEHFNVSPLTIRTLLVNHRRLDREYLEEDLGAAA